MKNYYSEMKEAEIGTTFNYKKNGMVINFIKVATCVWCIKIKYKVKKVERGVLIFNTLCTTIEAAEFRKVWTEN